MGVQDEIASTGKGARLNGPTTNTTVERQRARITCAARALTADDPALELAELLTVLGLNQPNTRR